MSENIDIHVNGLTELIEKFGRFDIVDVISEIMAQGGEDVVSAAKASTAFNDRTGNLRGSFAVLEASELSVIVGSDVRYAPFLEYGTVRMTERPHWRPSLAEVIPRMREDVQSAVVRALNE